MSRQWVYTASVKGRFQKIHRLTGFFLQAFLVVTPWVDVGGRPAVQIDIVRFNPDDSSIVIGFTVDDITASEGEDYFAPGNYSISFGPGQRSARILIPLVQDSLSEGDEAFVVELAGDNQHTAIDVFHRIVVMIRDDEPPAL